MQEVQSVVDVKFLLGIITILVGANIAIIIFIAKKYIKRSDSDHEKLNKMEIEQNIYHPKSNNFEKN